MKHHAGNTGLVSLVTLFDDWIAKKYKRVFPNMTGEIGWRVRFEQLENHLQSGPLSLEKLEEMVDARNSIIHHRGKPEFEWPKGKPHKVTERFLDFNEVWGNERVTIEGAVLTGLVNELVSHVKRWNRDECKYAN